MRSSSDFKKVSPNPQQPNLITLAVKIRRPLNPVGEAICLHLGLICKVSAATLDCPALSVYRPH